MAICPGPEGGSTFSFASISAPLKPYASPDASVPLYLTDAVEFFLAALRPDGGLTGPYGYLVDGGDVAAHITVGRQAPDAGFDRGCPYLHTYAGAAELDAGLSALQCSLRNLSGGSYDVELFVPWSLLGAHDNTEVSRLAFDLQVDVGEGAGSYDADYSYQDAGLSRPWGKGTGCNTSVLVNSARPTCDDRTWCFSHLATQP